jgi:peptidoglycan/LPS O-acetylase OafA/YrhL
MDGSNEPICFPGEFGWTSRMTIEEPSDATSLHSSLPDQVLARLSRRTTSGRYIAEIDGLRFVAISGVFLFHIDLIGRLLEGSWVLFPPFGQSDPVGSAKTDLLTRAASHGSYGVQLFFVVSGFVLALPFISWRVARGPAVSLRRYFLRRLTRIEPPYVVALAFLFVGATIASVRIGVAQFVVSMLYLHHLVYGRASPVDGVAWSLEVEIEFYLCVPLLALLFSQPDARRRRATIVLVAMLAIIFQAYGFGRNPRLGSFLGNYLQFFLVGWLLADLYVMSWDSTPQLGRRWDLVSLVGWPLLVAGLMATDRFRFESVVGPWLLLALCVAALRGTTTSRLLRNRWISTIGGMCYSIYLLHYPMLVLMEHWTTMLSSRSPALAFVARAAMFAPIVLVVSATFFVLVERPCMDPRWPTRMLNWLRRTDVSSST